MLRGAYLQTDLMAQRFDVRSPAGLIDGEPQAKKARLVQPCGHYLVYDIFRYSIIDQAQRHRFAYKLIG